MRCVGGALLTITDPKSFECGARTMSSPEQRLVRPQAFVDVLSGQKCNMVDCEDLFCTVALQLACATPGAFKKLEELARKQVFAEDDIERVRQVLRDLEQLEQSPRAIALGSVVWAFHQGGPMMFVLFMEMVATRQKKPSIGKRKRSGNDDVMEALRARGPGESMPRFLRNLGKKKPRAMQRAMFAACPATIGTTRPFTFGLKEAIPRRAVQDHCNSNCKKHGVLPLFDIQFVQFGLSVPTAKREQGLIAFERDGSALSELHMEYVRLARTGQTLTTTVATVVPLDVVCLAFVRRAMCPIAWVNFKALDKSMDSFVSDMLSSNRADVYVMNGNLTRHCTRERLEAKVDVPGSRWSVYGQIASVSASSLESPSASTTTTQPSEPCCTSWQSISSVEL